MDFLVSEISLLLKFGQISLLNHGLYIVHGDQKIESNKKLYDFLIKLAMQRIYECFNMQKFSIAKEQSLCLIARTIPITL